MRTHIEKNRENKTHIAANAVSQNPDGSEAAFQLVDDRPEAVAQESCLK